MAAAAYKTCTKCLQSFPLDHFLRHCNHACHNCASCQGVPTDGLTVPFSPLPSSLPLPASTLSLASAPTTTATATASTPSHLTPPLPLTVFLTKDSPTFHGLQQQLNDQVSALSDIAASLQHLLASSHNPEPQPPQPPSSQPVAATLASAMLPAANTAGSALGAPLPGESDIEVIQQVIDNTLPPQDLGRLCNPDLLPVDDEHKHAVLVNSVLIKSIPSVASTSSTHHFTKLIPDVCCFAKAWTVYTCIWACATNNPNLGAGLGAFLLHVIQTNHMHMWLPAQRPPPLQGSARHINGPMGPSDLSTPPLQGLAQLVSNSASTLDLGTPLLQGSAQSVIMPVGLGGTRTPPLQGLAWLFDLVPAALNVPSADQCLSLLLDTWSHNPGPCPNTSFASNVFDPASQPARHGSMQEHAFAWSTLLSLYPDPIYSAALPSVNTGISLGFIRIQYEGLQDLLAFVSQNPGCLLWKGDLQDTFWHIMTAEHDVHLLGFSYDGIHYCENVPTFGGSSSLWLFNLVTEFLNWLVMACLPTNWPINHYLDDTFGAIPASHAAHTLLPIHTLALAANALGLRLSPKKTFGASTKLKVLGFSCDCLKHALHGYKHLHSVGHSGAKLPITLPLLHQVLLTMGKMADLFPQGCLILQVAFALAFACFLCSGKLVWDRGTDRTTILTVSSIRWVNVGEVPETSNWALNTTHFWGNDTHTLPERVSLGGEEVLLFGLGPSGLNPLPQSTFITILCCAIQACGLPALQYAGHSFCHGAATWASQHSTSTADIQSLGRWSSDCYCCYIDRSAQECRTLVASALFSVRNGPLVPSSSAWRDPGLA
ncbi:uncharacterized protein UBRO2_00028 [Ustilago bromivora]|uniref:Reverse transcriptase domain-containing protein n=1 Tax=Ustilago bromivora TaxID=307758 RepID=A0A8H8QG19_9BASI|nr:uncharacterized protein UBRO2_00028 [Ustilago bromivora]